MFGLNDPFGLNSHISSIMNNFMMDPFSASMHQQQQQQSSRGRSRSNQVATRNHFDPFDNLMMSPFQQQQQLMAHHHRSAMNNPFALMDQMMGGFGRNIFNNMVNLTNPDINLNALKSLF